MPCYRLNSTVELESDGKYNANNCKLAEFNNQFCTLAINPEIMLMMKIILTNN